jgi:DNA-binding response OmpR family regulator
MKILAIDDSPTLRKFITKHLTAYSENYEVITAATGQEGVTLATKELPDLILLDFILPDFNGDEVCRKLLDNSKTSSIPVILMSSSAPDIEKNEDEFENIVRSMVKPFSPQLLCAGVSFVLKKSPAADSAPTAKPATSPSESATPTPAPTPSKSTESDSADILLSGKTSYFPMFDVLRGIEAEAATGVLHFELSNESGRHQAYFRNGKPVLVSTQNSDLYMSGRKLDIPDESKEYFETVKKKQDETGKPVFLQMVSDQYLPADQGNSFTQQYGHYLFSGTWTDPSCRFEFINLKSDDFPDYVPESPIEETMLNWITLTLRSVDAYSASVKAVATPEDIMSFSAEGYQRIQILSLSEEEVNFASQLGEGGATVGQSADALNLQWHEVSRILFLFTKTRVIDVWPST